MYQYRAYTFDKKVVEGTIDVPSEQMAEEYLLEAGYTHVLTLKKTSSPLSLELLFLRFHSTKKEDIVDLFNQLAALMDSGMPIVQALWLLAEQAPKAALRNVIYKLGQELSGGIALSQALSRYSRIVSAHYCEVIRVSEKSGDLTRGLRLVAGYIEKETSMSHNIKHMLSYPAFLAIMAVIVISILATVALPSLVTLFNSLGASLPLPTRILIALSSFISDYKFYLAAGLIGLVVIIMFCLKSSTVRKFLDSLALKLPVVRNIVIMRNICRFCRSSAMLLEAGLTLPQTINTIIGVIDSSIIRQALADIRQDLIKGKGLSQPMAKIAMFPRLLVDMIYIGEKTGTLQSSFATMADFYEKKFDQRVQRLLSMIEPASIIVVGLIISLIGIAIITPLYSIYQTAY